MKLLIAVGLTLTVLALLPNANAELSPIVLINGISGAVLKAKDNRRVLFNIPHKCNTFGKFKQIWLGLRLATSCGQYALSMRYDTKEKRFEDNEDVTIEVPDFGGTAALEYLGSIGPINVIGYMHEMVDYFVSRGYERKKSIRGAPYDWRLAADELQRRGYFRNLRVLIEEMYRENNNRKVTLVAHSMGGLVSHYFLTRYPGINQQWKDKHIHAWVTLSGAWSGSVVALPTVIAGKHIEGLLPIVYDLLADLLVPIVRTMQSVTWLFPRETVFENSVLISTPTKDYTASDYEQLFNDAGYHHGFEKFSNIVKSVTPTFDAPNVPTFCFYGTDVPTCERFIYDKELTRGDAIGLIPSQVIQGDGDGTVNLVSLKVCRQWSNMRSTFDWQEFNSVTHLNMVKNRQVLEAIDNVVRN